MIPLADSDLSQATVGTTGFIDLTTIGVSAGGSPANPTQTQKPAGIALLNQTSDTLQISFDQSAQGFTLPGGGWIGAPLPLGCSKVNYTVVAQTSNKLPALLHATYFMPGEQISVPQQGVQPDVGSQNNVFVDTQLASSGTPLVYDILDETQRMYLSGFDITGDKSASENTGLITIQDFVNPINGNTYNDFKFYVNQGPAGTVPFSIRFPFLVCSALGGAATSVKILTPNMAAAVYIVVYYQIY